MAEFSFVITIFFMLLGPVKIIPVYGALTRGADVQFKKDAALWATVIAAVLCAFVALAGELLLSKYRISLDALGVSGGLVLVISALLVIFKKSPPPAAGSEKPTAVQFAASPIAVPTIVPPAGIAAILIFMMLAPEYPGMGLAVAISLAIMMVLNYLVMRFIDQVLKAPGLGLVLAVLGSVLVFVQVCLGTEMILNALQSLGAFSG